MGLALRAEVEMGRGSGRRIFSPSGAKRVGMTRCFTNLHRRAVHFNAPPNFVTATHEIKRFAGLLLLLSLDKYEPSPVKCGHCKHMLSDILHLLVFGVTPSRLTSVSSIAKSKQRLDAGPDSMNLDFEFLWVSQIRSPVAPP